MKHVFRTTWKYWWSEDGFVLALSPFFVAVTFTRRTLLKSVQMRWDEITHIEEGASEYVIYGHHRRIRLPSPGWWSGKAKWEAAIFFQKQVALREIEIKPMRSLFSSRKKNNID